jgi:hypothetical protein
MKNFGLTVIEVLTEGLNDDKHVLTKKEGKLGITNLVIKSSI